METLEPIVWNLEQSVEVPELDDQHKKLISFYNEAVSKCSKDKTEERAYVDSVKETFVSLLSRHFETEEQFLSQDNYALYDEHVLEHTKLLEKINLMKSAIENNSWRMNLYILAITLKDMFMDHFNAYDMAAKDYFRERNAMQAVSLQRAG